MFQFPHPVWQLKVTCKCSYLHNMTATSNWADACVADDGLEDAAAAAG